jgi:uncharacterized phage-associated protein
MRCMTSSPAARPATIFDLAAAILARTGPVPAVQLHRLTYCAQVWHLDRNGELLTADPFEARYAGPVNPELFEALHGDFVTTSVPAGDPDAFTYAQLESIRRVAAAFGKLSSGELHGVVRAEGAYREAWGSHIPGTKGRVIDVEAMRRHCRVPAAA